MISYSCTHVNDLVRESKSHGPGTYHKVVSGDVLAPPHACCGYELMYDYLRKYISLSE